MSTWKTVLVALLIFWGIHVAAARGDVQPRYVDDAAWAVAVCESRGDFQHRTDDSAYGGAWSWFVGTWQLDRYERTWYDHRERRWRGMPLFPWNATPAQQYRVYRRSIARGRYFGCRE